MRSSKLFLGITACLLAMAGIAAARHFGPSVTRFYCTMGATPHCVSAGSFTMIPTAFGSKAAVLQFTYGPFHAHYSAQIYTVGFSGLNLYCNQE